MAKNCCNIKAFDILDEGSCYQIVGEIPSTCCVKSQVFRTSFNGCDKNGSTNVLYLYLNGEERKNAVQVFMLMIDFMTNFIVSNLKIDPNREFSES